MTTVIIILNKPNPYWGNKNVRRFVNPDVSGLELQEASVAIRESNQSPWHVITKNNIATMTIIFSDDHEN